MKYRFYILLLFDFVNDFQDKQKYFVNLNDVQIVLRQYLDKLMSCPPNIILYRFCNG